MRKNKKRNTISTNTRKHLFARLFTLVLIVVFLISLSFYVRHAYTRQQEELSRAQLIQEVQQSLSLHETAAREITRVETVPPYSPTLSPPEPAETEAYAEAEPTAPRQIRQRFLDLMEEFDNPDIVGHLRIENTNIDYIVLQAADNDFYLHRDIRKNKSAAGWIFMDFRNVVGGDDPNTILYGHNMRQNIMFHGLRHYREYVFFRAHPLIIFDNLYDDGTWEIFSFFKTSVEFYYIQTCFEDRDEFFALVMRMKSYSMYETGVEVFPEDRILLLSTCTNQSPDTRYVLAARLMRPD